MMQLTATLFDWLRHQARLRKWEPNLALGRRGEDLAHRFLRRQGYTIVARNYRLAAGDAEADIIAWDGDTLAFVEVKSRRTDEFGAPDRAVDQEKQHHIESAAREFARRAGIPWHRVRFDIVNVLLTRPPSVVHLKDAFRLNRTI